MHYCVLIAYRIKLYNKIAVIVYHRQGYEDQVIIRTVWLVGGETAKSVLIGRSSYGSECQWATG